VAVIWPPEWARCVRIAVDLPHLRCAVLYPVVHTPIADVGQLKDLPQPPGMRIALHVIALFLGCFRIDDSTLPLGDPIAIQDQGSRYDRVTDDAGAVLAKNSRGIRGVAVLHDDQIPEAEAPPLRFRQGPDQLPSVVEDPGQTALVLVLGPDEGREALAAPELASPTDAKRIVSCRKAGLQEPASQQHPGRVVEELYVRTRAGELLPAPDRDLH